MSDVIKIALRREIGGEDQMRVLEPNREQAIAPTMNRLSKMLGSSTTVVKIAEFPSAPFRIVPIIESLAIEKRVTPNQLESARMYAALASIALGRSQGVSRYGEYGESSPAWTRANTSDEQLQANRLFEKARYAAFGTLASNATWVLDETLIQAVEPLLLGDTDKSWNLERIGGFLGTYKNRATRSALGVQEIVAVLRRLRLFFRFNDDD